MEIDFLGLNSKNSSQDNFKAHAFIDSGSGGGDISLSLSSTSLLDCQTQFPHFPEKKTWKFPSEKMISTCNSSPAYKLGSLPNYNRENPSSNTGVMYNHNHRNSFELPGQPVSLTIFCTGAVHSFHDISAQKADHSMYMAANPASFNDVRKCNRGYTPTVAMARKATLARFLEKRSHRLTQTRKSHLMGRSLKVSEDSNMRGIKCNKKKMMSTIRP